MTGSVGVLGNGQGQTWSVSLARRPGAVVKPEDFAVTSEPVDRSRLAQGSLLVDVEYFGLNAGLRSRLGTGVGTTLGPPINVGDVPRSDAVGIVVAGSSASYSVGDQVVGLMPWKSRAVMSEADLTRLDVGVSPITALTLTGHVGATAYAGLVEEGSVRPGQVVWVSAAAGGVGSCAVQFAKALGATVIASAGGPERISMLRDRLGIQQVFDRRNGFGALRQFAPDGIDLYLDLVGGEHLATAFDHMKVGSKIVLVGRSGGDFSGPVLQSSAVLIARRLTLVGLSVGDHERAYDGASRLIESMRLAGNALDPVTTVFDGIGQLPLAFARLLRGNVIGRAIVRL